MRKSYTRRVTPISKVLYACRSREIAVDKIGEIYRQYGGIYYNSELVIEVGLGDRVFTPRYVPLYGTELEEYVYNFRVFEGFIKDFDKPYRYTDLGWYSKIEMIYESEIWQDFVFTQRLPKIQIEYNDHEVYLKDYNELFELPRLWIEKYKLL